MQNEKYPWTKGKARPVRRVTMFDKSIAGTRPWWSLTLIMMTIFRVGCDKEDDMIVDDNDDNDIDNDDNDNDNDDNDEVYRRLARHSPRAEANIVKACNTMQWSHKIS